MVIESIRQTYPDYSSCNGRVATWEKQLDDGLLFYEVIANPRTFQAIVSSPGNPEIIRLHDPRPGQRLRFTYIDEERKPLARSSVLLDVREPCMAMHKGTRTILDASETTALGDLAYTCFLMNVSR